jgi:mono/diheme cytochrome c family protein
MVAVRFGLPAMLVLGWTSAALAQPPVDYVRDVKPILRQHCVSCHGPKTAKAKLRLDTAALMLKGGISGPAVVPGKAADSPLMHALAGTDGFTAMPLKKPALPDKQVRLLAAWIDQGAKAPAGEVADDGTGRSHWAFKAPQRPPVPAVKNAQWPRNPIDHFVLARLELENLLPSPEADRVTLVRRVYLDLWGLPPAPQDVEAFLADTRPDAYERLVDRLLASPHYGERWGRHWLDLARYADTNGFSIDGARQMWMYRDWVVDAFNRDMPFDQFIIEQMAGDLLPGATLSQKIATGFHRNTLLNEEGGIDVEQFRVEAVADRVNTVGVVFLGLTMGCARCHDHKFDPISQREYYQLFAFLNNQSEPTLPVPGPDGAAVGKMGGKGKGKGPTALVLEELPRPRVTTIHLGGDFTRKGDVVQPGVPAVLHPFAAAGPPNRLDLARWLVDPKNPLLGRVTVNRLWQHYFGKGLVETENDFGTQGLLPSHPELLDWLATAFTAAPRAWSLKALHRLIVTSATYRQASRVRPDLAERDPDNRLLARQVRLRLDAEIIRDSALAVSGLLSHKCGGPSVYPPQPGGIYQFTQVASAWPTSSGDDRFRRGIYTFFKRSAPYPALLVFDAPDGNSACTCRLRSNTPLQALALLNDQAFLEMARGLAQRVLAHGPSSDHERLRFAFRLCLARDPSAAEAAILTKYLEQQLDEFRAAPDDARALLTTAAAGGPGQAAPALPPGTDVPQLAAWTAVARVLLNLDEFINRE